VVLPVRDHGQTRLRLVSKPEPLAADLLTRMGLTRIFHTDLNLVSVRRIG
jgi:hypothetical protein